MNPIVANPINPKSKSTTKVVTMNRKRTGRTAKRTRPFDNDQDIPKLAGKPDTELESMIIERTGIINYITDSETEE